MNIYFCGILLISEVLTAPDVRRTAVPAAHFVLAQVA